MDFCKGTTTFSTGKQVGFNNGIVGLSQELDLFEGYDASVHTHLDKEAVDEDFQDVLLTPEECRELAFHMLRLWLKFLAKHQLS